MKKMMSIATIALFMVGGSAFACDGCGCSEKKAKKKAECSSCTKDQETETKCGASGNKESCTKVAESKK